MVSAVGSVTSREMTAHLSFRQRPSTYLAAEAILREEDVAWLIERVVILRMSPHSGVVVGQPTKVRRYFAGVHQALKAALMYTSTVLSTPPFAQRVGRGKVSYELVVDHSS